MSSGVAALFNRGLMKLRKISAYGVNCGPRNAPMAKTIACALITQRFAVAKAVAKTNVVRTAEKRGPRASIVTADFFWFKI